MAERGYRCGECGKHSYVTMTSAFRWALIRSRATGRPLRVYTCPQGHGYHLTKQVHRVAA